MSSGELKPIIFYDIPCTTQGRPWSPNTMKTRYCLGYKRLPFTTVWVEFPDIAGLLRSKGITHPPYTLPAIEDPNTGAFIMDSLAIATYLDETYPETPTVLNPEARAVLERAEGIFSFGSRGAGAGAALNTTTNGNTSALGDGKTDNSRELLVFLILGAERLNPASKEYYHQTRAARVGERWTTLVSAYSASSEGRAECVRRGIEAIKGILRKVTALYDRQGGPEEGKLGGRFALGEEPCLLDFMVAGRMKFVLDMLTPSEAEALMVLDGGKLAWLVEDLEKYYKY